MDLENITLSVFTKPWKTCSIHELGSFVSKLGFEGIEFPLRTGYQVEPQNAEKGLLKLVDELKGYNLVVTSIASSTEENIFYGCAEAGIPIIRIMAGFEIEKDYLLCEYEMKKKLEVISRLCEKYNVKVGVQHHYGPMVSNSMGLRHLVESFDPRYIGAIWDAAHSALAGEEPEHGIDIVWSHLHMINLKNAFYFRTKEQEDSEAKWQRCFTSAKQGLASWVRISEHLKKRNYCGVICLTAEYTVEDQVNKLISEDMEYARALFKNSKMN
jgi:sugar phosphate isomerase/epimerase